MVGSLLTGISFAKSLSFALNIPCLGVNHLEGHLLSCFIKEATSENELNYPTFPFLVLIASGGHTMLIKANNLGEYEVLGETLDDAAGEALDKTAKLLGLTPPNGQQLSSLADQCSDDNMFHFPRPLVKKGNLNFSFSGLKTAAMLKIKKISQNDHDNNINYQANLAYSFQEAVMETLVIKSRQALKATKLNQLVIVGGVSANKTLRNKLLDLERDLSIKVFCPKLEFCTDNGAMIALAGAMRASKGFKDQNLDIVALSRWELQDCNSLDYFL